MIGREFPPVVARLRPGCCGGQMCAGARSHGAGELSTVTEQRRPGEHGDIRLAQHRQSLVSILLFLGYAVNQINKQCMLTNNN